MRRAGLVGGWGGGFTPLLGPSLVCLMLVGGVPAPEAYPNEFPLFPTMGNEGASGMVFLKQAWSPFGVSVDEEGLVQYELTIEVSGLPTLADESYGVWITTSDLDPIEYLGSLTGSGTLTGSTDWHQLMVVVSREPANRVIEDGKRWSGPVVLRGFSAGARVTPLANHSLFQQAPM